jgi:hypothetical protein
MRIREAWFVLSLALSFADFVIDGCRVKTPNLKLSHDPVTMVFDRLSAITTK